MLRLGSMTKLKAAVMVFLLLAGAWLGRWFFGNDHRSSAALNPLSVRAEDEGSSPTRSGKTKIAATDPGATSVEALTSVSAWNAPSLVNSSSPVANDIRPPHEEEVRAQRAALSYLFDADAPKGAWWDNMVPTGRRRWLESPLAKSGIVIASTWLEMRNGELVKLIAGFGVPAAGQLTLKMCRILSPARGVELQGFATEAPVQASFGAGQVRVWLNFINGPDRDMLAPWAVEISDSDILAKTSGPITLYRNQRQVWQLAARTSFHRIPRVAQESGECGDAEGALKLMDE
jgi:hypothetical protein